jgi:hypothetical protein
LALLCILYVEEERRERVCTATVVEDILAMTEAMVMVTVEIEAQLLY